MNGCPPQQDRDAFISFRSRWTDCKIIPPDARSPADVASSLLRLDAEATGFKSVFHSSGPENTFKLLHRASAVALRICVSISQLLGTNLTPDLKLL